MFQLRGKGVGLLVVLATVTAVNANTVFQSGDLRTNGNITACGSLCTLTAGDTDATWAQWAGFRVNFTIAGPTQMSAITYGFGGGTSLTGPVVLSGGFEPYLSLFTSRGTFLASTYLGVTCPSGAGTFGGNCMTSRSTEASWPREPTLWC